MEREELYSALIKYQMGLDSLDDFCESIQTAIVMGRNISDDVAMMQCRSILKKHAMVKDSKAMKTIFEVVQKICELKWCIANFKKVLIL